MSSAKGVAMNDPDRVPFTLRARKFDVPPVAGDLIAASKGSGVFRIVHVTSVRTAGDPKSHRFRVICERLTPAEVPEGAVILPWPRDRLPPPPRRRKALGSRPSADPGPPELAGARLDRIRAKAPLHLAMLTDGIRAGRLAGEQAQIARVARVGQDDRVQHGPDYGPGIRLRPIRTRGHRTTLRPADVEMEEGPDPKLPNKTVRRARRNDPLTALLKAGTITGRQFDAAEKLRGHLEASEAALTGAAQSEIHVAPHQRTGQSVRQLDNRTEARKAIKAITPCNLEMVMWIVGGGTITGYAAHAHTHHTKVAAKLKAGLGELARHYRLPGDDGPPPPPPPQEKTSHAESPQNAVA